MKLLKIDGDWYEYEVPASVTSVRRNVKSGEMEFVTEFFVHGVVSDEYQYFDGERWVRVTPKKTPGEFKGVKKVG